MGERLFSPKWRSSEGSFGGHRPEYLLRYYEMYSNAFARCVIRNVLIPEKLLQKAGGWTRDYKWGNLIQVLTLWGLNQSTQSVSALT